MIYASSSFVVVFPALSVTEIVRSHDTSILIVQSTLDTFVCVQVYELVVAVVADPITTFEARTHISSVTLIVVLVILSLSSFVGAVIVITGRSVSIIYD